LFLAIGLCDGVVLATGEFAAAMADQYGSPVTAEVESLVSDLVNRVVTGMLASTLVVFPTGRPASRAGRDWCCG
jgi:hypothetical protein